MKRFIYALLLLQFCALEQLQAQENVEKLTTSLATAHGPQRLDILQQLTSELLVQSQYRTKRWSEGLTKNRKQAEKVKVLKGLLSICSHCNKIRDEEGQWTQLEIYIDARSEAQFSHGICEACATTHYGDLEGISIP